MGVLAIWYGVSAILVAVCGEETLYDRQKGVKPTAGASRISLLVGIAGWKSKGQSSLITVSKHLVSVGMKPQLILPCKCPSLSQNQPSLTCLRSVHPSPLHLGNWHRNNRNAIHPTTPVPPR